MQTLILTAVAVWGLTALVVVSLCLAAKRGDAEIGAQGHQRQAVAAA